MKNAYLFVAFALLYKHKSSNTRSGIHSINIKKKEGSLKLKVTENRNWHTFAVVLPCKDGLLFVLLLIKKNHGKLND